MSLDLIKQLRETTGVGMMDCKKAIDECGSDYDKCVEYLRKKGLASAGKKAGRVAAEGLVGLSLKGNEAVIVEINSETDFVAKNDKFQNFFDVALDVVLQKKGSHDECAKALEVGTSDLTSVIGEKISFRRAGYLSVKNGAIATYIHNAVQGRSHLGQIGVIISLVVDGTFDEVKVKDFGKKICMHIAATRPSALTKEGVDSKIVATERAIAKEKVLASGKPEAIADKIVEGMLAKFFSDVVLLDQNYVLDSNMKVSEAVANFSKEIGSTVSISNFILFKVGEGIEKQQSDFAAEVAAMAGSGA